MKLLFCVVFFFMYMSTAVFAQKQIHGTIADFVTNTEVNHVATQLELLNEDSSFVEKGQVYSQIGKKKTTAFILNVKKEGKHIIRVSNPNYHTLYLPIKIKFYKREQHIDAGRLLLKRKPKVSDMQMLDEVTVMATKLQFYFDKDTLVYNASTFITQEGFVLNDILKKMPGMTISKDGEIFSNGRKVETLLLNGKDFFDNDRQTLLENLPAFMVKDVRIYHKDKDSTSLFQREREREGLVMNVRLKREYNSMIIGNAELAYGTDNHYYGRLFVMKIHDLHRWSVYAGANDVNRNEEVPRDGEFRNIDNGIGEKDFYNAGLNYNVDEREGDYSLEGKLRLQGSRELTSVQQISQNFLTGGDAFTQNSNEQLAKNFSIQTDHAFHLLQKKQSSFSIKPALTYIRSKNKLEQLYAMFDRNVADSLGKHWRDSLRVSNLGETLRAYGVNHMTMYQEQPISLVQGSLEVNKRLKILHTQDYMLFNAKAAYMRNETENFIHRNINYIRQSQHDWRNTYNNVLNEGWNWEANASYVYQFASQKNRQTLTAKIGYQGARQNTNDAIYNLQQLGGDWSSPSLSPSLGMLPSQVDMLSTMDAGNSKRFEQYNNTYQAELAYNWNRGNYHFNVALPLDILHNSLNFHQNIEDPHLHTPTYNPSVSRTLVTPNIRINLYNWLRKQTGMSYNVSYNMTRSLPTLIYMIDQTNDANPLLVYKGNGNLKNSTRHQLNGQYYWAPSTMNNHRVSANYNLTQGATAMSTLLDKTTGVYTYMPVNVDGNQSFNISISNNSFLSKKYTNSVSNNLSFNYVKSVDYSGASIDELSAMSTAKNYRISEEFAFNYMNRKRNVMGLIAPYINYQRTTGTRQNFKDFHAFEFGLKYEIRVELPRSFRITSNARSVSRRGYNSSEMNDNEIIWNATLSKAFKKGWKLSLEGTDLLGQYKNVVRYVNAQGRTESMYNHLGRYAMLHVVYQFNTKSKIIE